MTAPFRQDKYDSQNPLMRSLLRRFFETLGEALDEARPASILDAGCGEGEPLRRGLLTPGPQLVSLDVRAEALSGLRGHAPAARALQASVLELPFREHQFDLVLSCEVLEHLARPESALAELHRVARRHVLLSVPHEPWFRLGNLARLKYAETWGNHPEHVQHWTPESFRALLEPVFAGVSVRLAFPWIIALCRKS